MRMAEQESHSRELASTRNQVRACRHVCGQLAALTRAHELKALHPLVCDVGVVAAASRV